MTNEEAIEVLEQDMFSVYCTDLKEAMGMAVNSLKAWEKIRAEIKKESEVKTIQLHWGEAMGLNKAIEIIDKHLSELKGDTKEHDCEHCSRTYGTLGCCSTVSNKWVYSCEEGHREYEETHKETEDGNS